jgi:hypothetical protein
MMKMSEQIKEDGKYKKNCFFEKVEKQRLLRVNPALALEIGFTESLIFLQLEFLIAVSENVKEGRRWTFQSVDDLHKMLPWLSKATINRAIKSLEKKGLILVGNFNKYKYDRTRWFAINLEEARKLKSIRVKGGKIGTAQTGTATPTVERVGRTVEQHQRTEESPIPETTTENTTETTTEICKYPKEIKTQTQPMPSASIEVVYEAQELVDSEFDEIRSEDFLEPSTPPPVNPKPAAGPTIRTRPLLTDTETGPVKRIFDFYCKATQAQRAKLTEKIRAAVASRISANRSLNPDGYREDDIKLAILGCLASRDKRDAFIYRPEKADDAFIYDEDSASYQYFDTRSEYDREQSGFRWKTDLKHICAHPDRITRFLEIAMEHEYGLSDIQRIEELHESDSERVNRMINARSVKAA